MTYLAKKTTADKGSSRGVTSSGYLIQGSASQIEQKTKERKRTRAESATISRQNMSTVQSNNQTINKKFSPKASGRGHSHQP